MFNYLERRYFMKISKINNIDNKNLKTEATLLLNGILVGIFAGIVGAS